jgi:hypothetical protein
MSHNRETGRAVQQNQQNLSERDLLPADGQRNQRPERRPEKRGAEEHCEDSRLAPGIRIGDPVADAQRRR